MVEFIVVVALVAILIVFGLSRMLHIDAQRQLAASDELSVHLRHARSYAMSCERTIRITFDTTANRYDVEVADTNTPGAFVAAEDPAQRGPWTVFIDERFPGVKLDAVNIDGGGVLTFSERTGTPGNSTGGVLVANAVVTFASGARVSVTPDTGNITSTQ